MGSEGITMEFEPKMPPVALVEQASADYRRTRETPLEFPFRTGAPLTGEINYARPPVMMQMLI